MKSKRSYLLAITAAAWSLLVPAEAGALSPIITISPSTCQIDDSDSLAEVSFFNSYALLTGTSLSVTLRCNVPNPGLDFDDSVPYDLLGVTYKDSSATASNFVRVRVFGVNVETGGFTEQIYAIQLIDSP